LASWPDLNYENNILLCDAKLTADVCERQQQYISRSIRIAEATVASWSIPRRFWNNTVALLGPIL